MVLVTLVDGDAVIGIANGRGRGKTAKPEASNKASSGAPKGCVETLQRVLWARLALG
jgi:hypothetical protein